MTIAADASMMMNPVTLFLEADPVVKAIMVGLAVLHGFPRLAG